ncbi:hypothetical protein [Bacillus sp. SYJ]|uniref:hypothetical protein n=1 Tax=Bacillus sp. SYJ TaxID=2529386 RepID=UPI0010360DA2|nr:hypothetical protein [Bacillus sp. SYJ]
MSIRHVISVESNEHKFTQYVREIERDGEGEIKRVWLTREFEYACVFSGITERYVEENILKIENWINKLDEDYGAKCEKILVNVERIN